MKQLNIAEVNNLIEKEYTDLMHTAIQKNISYNNSIFNGEWRIKPSFNLTQEQTIELGIVARINDKLQRIEKVGILAESEDNIKDLIGYLVLLRVNGKINNNG